MKIVMLDGQSIVLDGDPEFTELQAVGETVLYQRTEEDQVIPRLQNAEVCITNKVRMGEEQFRELPDLSHVAVSATGVNNIDLRAAERHGITVSNVAGYSTDSVAQHVFALILSLAGRIEGYAEAVRSGDWAASPVFTVLRYPTHELAGKTLGILGYGATGKAVARIGRAFGMSICVTTRSPVEEDGIQRVPLFELATVSDIVSLHCPLTDETSRLIDREFFLRMKKNALLINTARGGVLDEEALRDALLTGRIAGAGLDVLSEEPPSADNPLTQLNHPGLIITPHCAWSTVEARRRLVSEIVLNLRAYMRGDQRNIVRPY
jgi:glycerate dehydrogenase